MYVASWSGGKDSTATIILAHEHGEPLDLIIFAEVMFDKGISGELPEHIEFVKRTARTFESWGYPVQILRAKKCYLDIFHGILTRGKRKGFKRGFPMKGKCTVNRELKLRPINQFNKEHPNAVHYIGIAKDEPKRLARLQGNKISLLAKYYKTEADALELCKQYGMLSPIYEYTRRGGCWFCPNARDKELRHLRKNHRDLWDKLLALEKEPGTVGRVWDTLTQTTIHQKERQFDMEEKQVRWDI